MGHPEVSTETSPRHRVVSAEATIEPALFLAFDANDPMALPLRWRLGRIAELSLRRGDQRHTSAHRRSRSQQALAVAMRDPFMSARHATLRQKKGQWFVCDDGSKNGTFVNGHAVTDSVRRLVDGDLIEAGRCFFIFRDRRSFELDDAQAADCEELRAAHPAFATMIPDLHRAFGDLTRAAHSTISVILGGESGSGKEVVAKAIHALSGRSGEYIAINCGAIPAALVASELFGHKAGAFSGATSDREGLIRAADGGTLFLDEIAELPHEAQVAFLRVLEDRHVRPVGSTRTVPVDIRLVCASNKDLDEQVKQGSFRRDLFARLGAFHLQMPPLRKRREDFGLLVRAVLRELVGDSANVRFGPEASRALLSYSWPMNIRELQKVLEAAWVLAGDGAIDVRHLPKHVREGATQAPPQRSKADLDDHVRRLMTEHRGNISAVARTVGKDRKQIKRILARLNIDADSFRAT